MFINCGIGRAGQGSGQVASDIIKPADLDQVVGEIAPEEGTRQGHHAQLGVKLKNVFKCCDGTLVIPVIVSHDALKRIPDRSPAGTLDQAIGQCLELGDIVLAELDGGEATQGGDVVGPTSENLLVCLNGLLTMVASHQAEGPDLHVVQREWPWPGDSTARRTQE